MQQITSENIRKIQCHRYYDDNILNREIYRKTLVLMGKAYSYKGYETLLLMNGKTYEYMYTTQFLENGVTFNDAMLKELHNDKSDSFIAFHNHPEDTSFSLGDVNVLLEYEKIFLLILCTNSCKYSAALYKTKKCNRAITYILSILIRISFKLGLFTVNSDGMPLIKWLQKKGILYTQYKNY